MTQVEPIQYKYSFNMKVSALGVETPLSTAVPSIEDLVVSSRKFDKFEEAIASANKFVLDTTVSLNGGDEVDPKFKMISEINPRFTGKQTISQEWGHHEIVKLWIVDNAKTKARKDGMQAVGLAQVLEIPGEPVSLN